MLPKSTVLSLSQGSPDVVGIAKNKLFEKDKRRGKKKKFVECLKVESCHFSLCVHTRRGDFLESPLVYPSNEIFAREATKFVYEKGIYNIIRLHHLVQKATFRTSTSSAMTSRF